MINGGFLRDKAINTLSHHSISYFMIYSTLLAILLLT